MARRRSAAPTSSAALSRVAGEAQRARWMWNLGQQPPRTMATLIIRFIARPRALQVPTV